MNRRDSSTRDYFPNPRPTRTERLRRRRRKQVTILAILGVLALLLLISAVFVLKDVIGGDGDTTTAPTNTPGGNNGAVDFPNENAFDGDSSTYMLSTFNQIKGAYFAVGFGDSVSVSSVRIISAHPDYYIERGELQLSSDGNTWTSIGEKFTGDATEDGLEHTMDVSSVSAKYLRVCIVENKSVPMAINEISVINSAGESVELTFAGSTAYPFIPEADNTTAPPVTTAPNNGYTTVIKTTADVGAGPLVLVNTTHPFTFPGGEANIENLYAANERADAPDGSKKALYQLASAETISLDATALTYFKNMCRGLVTEKGLNVYVDNNGGYRSYATQEALYAAYPKTASAPGQSDHNSGYGINMAVFMDGRVYSLDSSNESCRTILAWINANAHKYGFVRRFDPAKEAFTGMPAGLDDWHYRYVGEAHAFYMHQNNLCLEEYIAVLENYYSYGSNHLKFTTDTGKNYEIYFVAQTGSTTTVPVPTGKNYTISGNNHSGFIVTIEG